MTGKFITFEGPEGSGKSVQVFELASRLKQAGREVVKVRAPGGTPLCEGIRGLLQHDMAGESPVPRAEIMLFFASHAQLAEKIIRPALERGCIVIADRYIDSTTAYQGYARGLGPEVVRAMGRFAVNGLMPDKTILLDVSTGVGFSRIKGELDRMERAGMDFHERVRAAYLEMAAKDMERWAIVDGSQDVAIVRSQVWDIAEHILS